MKSVRIEKEKLLVILKKNKIAHEAEYERAFEGYISECRKELEKQLENLSSLTKSGVDLKALYELQEPKMYSEKYRAAIMMLELSADDTVELDAHTFSCYVMDEWDWKDTFLASNRKYLG